MMKRRNLLKLLGAGTAGLMVSPSVSAGLFSWFSGDDKPGVPEIILKTSVIQNLKSISPIWY